MKIKTLSVLTLLLLTLLSTGCTTTTTTQDTEMLQKAYSTVYRINPQNYIVADSVHVYHVTVTLDGKVSSKVKIK